MEILRVKEVEATDVGEAARSYLPGTETVSTRLMPDDVFAQFGGPVICYDATGNVVKNVRWVDPVVGTFGQIVTDEQGRKQIDPANPDQLWVIERIGKLRLERKS